MDEFNIKIEEKNGAGRNLSFRDRLRRIVLEEKLANAPGLLLLSGAAILTAILARYSGVAGVLLVILPLLVSLIIYAIVRYPKVGITILLTGAYFIMWVYGWGIDFPLGTLMDGVQGLLILGFFIQQKYRSDWQLFKEPIGIIILIWVAYNIAEFANPSAESRLAWVYTIRSVALVMLMYFIFSRHIQTRKFLRFILKLWLCFALFAALYGLKQEYIGFFAFEEKSLEDPRVRALLFINGHWRKFSIFPEPVAYSYNMVTACLFCIAMIFGPFSKWKKIIAGMLAVLFFIAMIPSGTRGAFVLIPAALILLAILKFNKRMIVPIIVTALFFAALIFIPTGNPGIQRFQSAFRPSEDASYNVRKANQKRIQPFIQTHPLGGGLGATGVWGTRFSPHSFLAQFPPDSGYVRVAVELGSIGLLLICTLMFIILRTGIKNYFSIRDPELKVYCFAMTLIIFAYAVGNYPQEAIVQFPSNIYFYLFTAIITITRKLDQAIPADKK